jgi:hypothetical protein
MKKLALAGLMVMGMAAQANASDFDQLRGVIDTVTGSGPNQVAACENAKYQAKRKSGMNWTITGWQSCSCAEQKDAAPDFKVTCSVDYKAVKN